jgi:tetratricopeptide (TPR) repeat protein
MDMPQGRLSIKSQPHNSAGQLRIKGFTFAATVALVLYYALRGGSYDSVVLQEEALALWWVLGLGFLVGVFPRARQARGALIPLAALAVLGLWTAISLSWTSSDERTLAEVARVMHYVGILTLAWAVVDRTTWRSAAAGLSTGVLVVTTLAVASRLWPASFPTDYVGDVLDTDRLSYPLNYWNAVGAWSVMGSVMALAWSSHADRLPVRLLGSAALPVCGLAVYLTYSRAGAIGIALGAVLVLLLGRNRFLTVAHAGAAALGTGATILVVRDHTEIARASGNAGWEIVLLVLLAAMAFSALVAGVTWLARGDVRWRLSRPWGRVAVAAGVVALLGGTVIAGTGPISRAWADFRDTGEPDRGADPAQRLLSFSGARYEHWSTAVDAFEREPLKGVGAGTYEFWRSAREEGFVRDAHSLYFEQLAELGVPGFLLTLTALVGLAVLGYLRRRSLAESSFAPYLAAYAGFLVFLFHAGVDWMWEVTAVGAVGLGSGAVASFHGSGRPRRRGAIRAVGVALAIIACLVQVPGLISVSRVRDSRESFQAGDTSRAFSQVDEAIDAEPWAATPYVQRGLVEEASGRLPAARRDLLLAIERERRNWRHYLLLARVEAELGNAEAALRAFRHARRLRRDSAFLTTGG